MAAWTSSRGSFSSSLPICFSVNGSGDAKISASTIALSSAVARGMPSCPSRPSSPESPFCPFCPFALLTMVLRIADRMRRVGGSRAFVDTDRPETRGLEHANQLEANHLEQRQERDDEALPFGHVREQIFEAARLGFRQAREQLLDARFHRNLLRRQQHFRPQLCALD